MALSRYSFVVLGLASILTASPQVSWVQKPPQEIHSGQQFDVAWKVEGLEGSYHSLCFFCPEDAGEVCRKGPQRLDSQIFDANDHGEYHYSFVLSEDTPEGRYYATAIGAYSRSDYYPSKSILVTYQHQHTSSENSSDTQKEETDSNNSQQPPESESSNTTMVVRTPVVAPVYYWDDEETTADVDVHTSSGAAAAHEHHENQQERHQDKHDAMQRQDRLERGHESHHGSGHHGRQHSRGRGGRR